jgi:hypothetical protein
LSTKQDFDRVIKNGPRNLNSIFIFSSMLFSEPDFFSHVGTIFRESLVFKNGEEENESSPSSGF